MPSIFDQFPSQAPVDVAGTPFQDQPSAVSKLLFGKPEGPDVRDPQKMAPARYIVAGGKTLDQAQDAAWDDATASPRAKRVREIMGSEPMKRLMDLANFLGPGPKMMPRPTMAPEGPKGIKAYHGSPHDFDRFDLSKIGSGEGAQAYGHGLYFAEAEKVAQQYRDALGSKGVDWGKIKSYDQSLPLTDEHAAWVYRQTQHPSGEPAMAAKHMQWGHRDLRDVPLERLEAVIAKARDDARGRMYEVNIKADPADFLDWDAPLAQQSDKVRAFVDQVGGLGLGGNAGRGVWEAAKVRGAKNEKGQMVYLDGERRGSELLRQSGIPGIRYKDQGSRGTEGGTSNYVVFDDNLIDIIRKYGLAGLLAGGGALSQGGGGNGDAY